MVISGIFKAYAKINLTLDITGKLPDGYHLIDSVMQRIPLADELYVNFTDESLISRHNERGVFHNSGLQSEKTDVGITLFLESDKKVLKKLPKLKKNIIFRAFSSYLNLISVNPDDIDFLKNKIFKSAIEPAVHIILKKNIPLAGGLGGSSSDAAAVLDAMDKLLGIDMSIDKKARLELSLGADLPFVRKGGIARCRGIGDQLSELESPGEYSAFIFYFTSEGIDSGFAYKRYDELLDSGFSFVRPNFERFWEAYESYDFRGMNKFGGNVFENVLPENSDINLLLQKLRQVPETYSAMSGSGPSCFLLCRKDKRKKLSDLLRSAEYAEFFDDKKIHLKIFDLID